MRPGLRPQILLLLGLSLVTGFVPLLYAIATYTRYTLQGTRRIVALLVLTLSSCAAPRRTAAPIPARPSPDSAPAAATTDKATSGNRGPASAEQPVSDRSPVPPSRGTVLLDVPGFDPAIVSFPENRPGATPLVVVAHGAGVVPADICHVVRLLFQDRATLLCLSGPRVAVSEEGRYFPDHHVLERIFTASLDALSRKYPAQIDYRRAIYVGYSQGATMGALMLPAHGGQCPRLLLIEGGFADWSLTRARAFKSSGGERVLFACGTKHCAAKARDSMTTLRHAGIDAYVVSELSAGHTYGGMLARRVESELPKFLEGDERFR